jgi:hypothetical protein
MTMDNTLLTRCQLAHHEAVHWEYTTSRVGTRATLEHLAAELTVAGHQDAAQWLLGQLTAQVIELRPRTPGDAA